MRRGEQSSKTIHSRNDLCRRTVSGRTNIGSSRETRRAINIQMRIESAQRVIQTHVQDQPHKRPVLAWTKRPVCWAYWLPSSSMAGRSQVTKVTVTYLFFLATKTSHHDSFEFASTREVPHCCWRQELGFCAFLSNKNDGSNNRNGPGSRISILPPYSC